MLTSKFRSLEEFEGRAHRCGEHCWAVCECCGRDLCRDNEEVFYIASFDGAPSLEVCELCASLGVAS